MRFVTFSIIKIFECIKLYLYDRKFIMTKITSLRNIIRKLNWLRMRIDADSAMQHLHENNNLIGK